MRGECAMRPPIILMISSGLPASEAEFCDPETICPTPKIEFAFLVLGNPIGDI